MTEDEMGRLIVDAAVQIHQQMGPGLLETVYEVILAHELRRRGLHVERQVPILNDKRLGYLLNFHEALMKHGITRIANHLQECTD
jgi:hypothetical protein